MRPPFITVEGVDGAGKSSHMATMVDALQSAGWSVVNTKEPGGTELGERLRFELKQTPMDLSTMVFIAFASRCEHLAQVIRPALDSGQAVISDRFTDSTFAYQGAGDGYPIEKIEQIEKIVHGDLSPDLTLLFDVPQPVAEARRKSRLTTDSTVSSTDKFDIKKEDWFARASQGYRDRMAKDPERFTIIDSSQSLEAVGEQVKTAMVAFIDRHQAAQRPSPSRRRTP